MATSPPLHERHDTLQRNYLASLVQRVMRAHEENPYGFDEVDDKLLKLLTQNGNMTRWAMVEQTGITYENIQRRMKRLTTKGIVTFTEHRGANISKRYEVTDKGKRVLEKRWSR